MVEYHLERSRYKPTLYFKRHEGNLVFILVAQVDNYVYAGIEAEIVSFEKFLQDRFRVGALDRGRFEVMGCEIDQSLNGTAILTQRACIEDLK